MMIAGHVAEVADGPLTMVVYDYDTLVLSSCKSLLDSCRDLDSRVFESTVSVTFLHPSERGGQFIAQIFDGDGALLAMSAGDSKDEALAPIAHYLVDVDDEGETRSNGDS